MSLLNRTRDPSAPTAPAQPVAPTDASGPAAGRVPQTRWGAAWVGICTATVVFAALIVFMLQNTRIVEVSFLGLHGTLPLAVALLIAMVCGIILAGVFGTARIAQLRRLARGRRH